MARPALFITILSSVLLAAPALAAQQGNPFLAPQPRSLSLKNLHIPPNKPLPPEQQAALQEEISRHHFQGFGADYLDAVLHAAELLQGIQFPDALRADIRRVVQETGPVRISLPSERAAQEPRRTASKSRSPRSLTPLSRYTFEAGIGEASIAMPVGVPVPGFGHFPPDTDPILDPYDYAHIYRGNKGTHDHPRVKVLVLKVNGVHWMIVGLDAVAAMEEFRAEILSRIDADPALELQRERFLLTATHNHSGPGATSRTPLWWFTTADFFDQRIWDLMMERVMSAISQAYANLEPASIGYGQVTDQNMNVQFNRRYDPEKIDKELGVIRIDRVSDGSAKCVLFNLGIHASALRSWNELYTGDFCGYAEHRIEKDLGGNCLAMFINSSEGDIDTIARGYDEARDLGNEFARRVLDMRTTLTTSPTVGLLSSNHEHIFPPPYNRPGFEDPTIPLDVTIPLSGLMEDRCDFTAIRLNDDAVIATFPGEAITDIGWNVKADARALGYQNVFVFGLSQHHLAYFTTAEEYWQGRYEAGASLFGPEGGELVRGFAMDEVDNVSR